MEEKPVYDLGKIRKEFASLRKYAAMESASQDVIGVKKIYVDMTGDIKAALVLDELIFWTLPREGKISGLRIWKEGVLWLAVSRSEWWGRKRLTERQADRAIDKLTDLDLVIKNVFKFNNFPTTHLRLNIPVFFEKYANALTNLHPPENEEDTLEKDITELYEMMGFPFSPNGDTDSPNGDTDSPNGENINIPHTSLTHYSRVDAEQLLCKASNLSALPTDFIGKLETVLQLMETYGKDETLTALQDCRSHWIENKRKDNRRNYSVLNPTWIDWAIVYLSGSKPWEVEEETEDRFVTL